MIWIILAVFFFVICVLMIVGVIQIQGDEIFGGGAFFLIFVGVLIFSIHSGTSAYTNLNAKYKAIQLMRVRVDDVRNAYYKNENKGTLVAGSIENIQQSTTLSEAIRCLNKKENNYIEEREEVLFAKESRIYWWFLDGMFISDKVKELPELDKEKL